VFFGGDHKIDQNRYLLETGTIKPAMKVMLSILWRKEEDIFLSTTTI